MNRRRITISFVVLCLAAGCAIFIPDQPRYSHNVFWRSADVYEYPPGEKDKWFVFHVTNGTHTVLRFKSGHYSSRTTTAHSSHGSFYILLPESPEVGKTYTCSPTNGTLRYSGFHGYDMSYMHLGRPAGATVKILNISEGIIKAEAEAYCDVVNGRPRVTDPNDTFHWPGPEHKKGTFMFTLVDLSEWWE